MAEAVEREEKETIHHDSNILIPTSINNEAVVLSEVHINPDNGSEPTSALMRETTFVAFLGPLEGEIKDDEAAEVKTHNQPNDDQLAGQILSIKISHRMATTLEFVGCQVWCGALLLCDFLIWISDAQAQFGQFHHLRTIRSTTVLEIGCGTGLPSIAAARYASCVFATDVGELRTSDGTDLLAITHENVNQNGCADVVHVRALDLHDSTCPLFDAGVNEQPQSVGSETQTDSDSISPYAWKPEDVDEFLLNCDVLIAADIVYLDSTTFKFVQRLFGLLVKPGWKDILQEEKEGSGEKDSTAKIPLWSRVLYLAIEKRIQFTLEQREVRAPAYDYLLDTIKAINDNNVEEARQACEPVVMIKMEIVPLENIPQRFDYDRNGQLELLVLYLQRE
ncbi:Methyltransferase-like protein 22 [Blyttiomyces sp. JEL0837]|nr:Methyltransferase-like protein 22 [Blyttiomyces sp. JEL0837]